jgi:hypothetical protein
MLRNRTSSSTSARSAKAAIASAGAASAVLTPDMATDSMKQYYASYKAD